MAVRRLTPPECERLQGFPDGWTEGFSDSARYRMLGNAVCVNVTEWIARRLLETMDSFDKFWLDWEGKQVSRDEAKDYIRDYGKLNFAGWVAVA
jgi:hypothetical protein